MKNFQILTLILVLSLSACSGQSLVTTSDDASNNVSETELSLSLAGVHHPHKVNGEYLTGIDQDDHSKIITTNLGYEVTLTTAMLYWNQVRLYSDGTVTECTEEQEETHTTDAWQNIIEADFTSQSFATVSLSNSMYCSYELTLGSDDEAGLMVQGTWSLGSQSGTIDWEIMESFVASRNFKAKEDGETVDHALHYVSESSQSVTFGQMYTKWFDDIDFAVDGQALAQDQLVTNIQNTVHQHLGSVDHAH